MQLPPTLDSQVPQLRFRLKKKQIGMGFGKFLARVLFQELGVSVPSSVFHVLFIRVHAIIVGTGGHFLIRLGSQNEWDGQRDRGPEDGTIVKGL